MGAGTPLPGISAPLPLPEHLASLQVLANPWVMAVALLLMTRRVLKRIFGQGAEGEAPSA